MIPGFTDRTAERIWNGQAVKKIPIQLQIAMRRKLRMLNSATGLTDLKAPPGNRLEALKRDRKGQFSIRINDRWRICFHWRDNDAHEVEIIDYH
jgi:proteic killer suppression protein